MNKRLLKASLLVAFFFGVDKVVAFGLRRLINQSYGLTPVLDAFNVANNLPDLLLTLISGGALVVAFIPILTETIERSGRAKAWELFSQVANLAFILTAVVSIGVALFALELVRGVVVPGFQPDQQRLVAELMRLNLVATLIFSISGLVMGALQANQHFLLPALAPTFYNIGQIIGMVAFAPVFGIYGLAYGVILGAVLHLGVQIPGLVRHQFRWTPHINFTDPDVQRVLRLMGPRILTFASLYLTLSIVRDNLASWLKVAGSISALDLGWSLMQLPETVIGTALGTALLPTLSELVTRGNSAELRRLLRRAITILLSLTVPITLVGILFIRPVVRWFFEGRAFTAANTELVVLAVQMYLIGLAGHSLKEVVARTFYAYKDVITPLFTSVLTLSLFIGFSVALTPLLNFAALALANSIAFTVEALVMLFILHRRRIL